VSKEINNPSRSELITDFVKTNPNYYIDQFQKIGSKPTFSFSFNIYAAILGPIWFGMRNIWNWALTFLIIETFSVVQIVRGLFGNITKDAVQKIEQVQSTIAFRNKQLEAAITNNPDKVEVYKRNIKSLEDAMQGYIDEVNRIEASAIWITVFGIALLIVIKDYSRSTCKFKIRKKIF
jgi:glycine betaine/proline transport system permease protein